MQVILLAFIVYRGYLGRHSNFQVRSCTTNWSYTFIQARNVQKIHFMIYKNVVSLCHFGRIVSIFWTYCVCSVDFDARLRFLVHRLLFQLHGSLFHVFVCSRVKCKIDDVHRTKNNVQMIRWRKKNNSKWYIGALLVLPANYGVIGVIKISLPSFLLRRCAN